MTPKLRVAYVSTFPPRQCGLATFTADLTAAIDSLARLEPSVVVAVTRRGQDLCYPESVRYQIVQEEKYSYAQAANFINANKVDVVVIQHEFGIYGGTDGNFLLSLLGNLRRPVITTFHTVLPNVDSRRKALVQEIAAHSAAVVSLAHKGKEILTQVYKIAPAKIRVIHHGVPVLRLPPPEVLKQRFGLAGHRLLCTFGLLHPGKGIEYVLRALPRVCRSHPDIRYFILGQTHPEIRRRDGEAYREMLEQLVHDLHLEDHVIFVNRYLTQEELLTYLQMIDIYLTPYLEPQQISSGTLAYAVCLGKTIISTPYLYAQEMLAGGRGLLVPFADSESLALALEEVLADPRKAEALGQNARIFGEQMTWPRVAEAYIDLFYEVMATGAQTPQVGGGATI